MLALGFFMLLAGGIIAVAGVTGSSVHSVVQGKPDKGNSGGLGSTPTSGTVAGATTGSGSLAFPSVSGGKAKFGGVLQFAKAELGQPYVWGGSEPGGFDCSGLVQYVFDKAGIKLPRTAQEQYDATRKVGPGESLLPGMLVFFGSSASDITHVGIYLGEGKLLDAPHTGADVRVENTPTQIGASYGADKLIGFTEP